MTVPSTARRAGPFLGNGVTTTFSFSFKTFAAGDLVVTRTASNGVETTLVLNSDYSVSLNADQDASPGGTITYPLSGSPLAAGQKLTIVGDLDYEQTTDLLGGGAFNARVIEDTFDRTVIQIQQLEERLDRALVAPVSDTPVDMTMPTAANRANRYLSFDATGKPISTTFDIDAVQNASTAAVAAAAAAAASQVAAASSQSVAQTQATFVANTVAATTPTVVNFSGDGAAVAFTLPSAPGAEENTLVFIGGVYRQKSEYSVSGTTLTFTSAPPAGTNNIEVQIGPATNIAVSSSLGVSFLQAGAGAVTRTAQSKLRDVVSVKDFGAVGDGVADDTAAIQSAIDFAIYNNTPAGKSAGSVFIPEGIYRITNTIHLGYGTSYRSAHVFGDGVRYRAVSGFCGTGIVADFNDRPAFAISGGRNSSIKRLTIQGKNATWITSNNLGMYATPTVNDLVEANWVDPAFPASASSRYAPYAAIAIDPYAGVKPAVAYPDVVFPAWMGAVAQYGKVFSSACVFEDLNIGGFVVGIANQPCDADGNGDYTKCNRVYIEYCQFGISIGNTQSRLFSFENGTVVGAHTGIVTAKHGRQAGKPNFTIRGSEFGAIINWLQVPNLDYGGCPSFENCYGETVYRIGDIGTNAAGQSPISFRNCEIAFQSWNFRGIPSTTLAISGRASVVFDGCIFSPRVDDWMSLVIEATLAPELVAFDNCQIAVGHDTVPPAPIQYALKATTGVVFAKAQKPASFTANRLFASVTGWFTNLNVADFYRDFIPSISQDYGVLNHPGDAGVLNKASFALPTVNGRDVTYVFTGYVDWQFVQMGLDVGDCVWDTQTRTNNVVIARTGTSVTLRAYSGFNAAGNLLIAPAASGLLYCMKTRVYAVQQAILYGNTTAANNTMSGIARDDNFSGTFLTNATWGVAVDDYVLSSSNYDQVVNLTGTKITAVISDSFTVAGTFKLTATHRRLPLFIRKPPANI